MNRQIPQTAELCLYCKTRPAVNHFEAEPVPHPITGDVFENPPFGTCDECEADFAAIAAELDELPDYADAYQRDRYREVSL
jgi:hypothetical protein